MELLWIWGFSNFVIWQFVTAIQRSQARTAHRLRNYLITKLPIVLLAG